MNIKELKEAAEKAVGWETDAEWELELSAFHAANREDVPTDARELVGRLWKQYCIAAENANPSTILSLIARLEGMSKAVAVFSKWTIDVSTLGELADLEARLGAVGVSMMQVGEWSTVLETPASPIEEVVENDRTL